VGAGLGAFTPANNAAVMLSAPRGRTGVVSGMVNMTRGFGTALGVALAGALYTATASEGLTPVFAALGVLAGIVAAGLLAGRWLAGSPVRSVVGLEY
jgi:MFS family permease